MRRWLTPSRILFAAVWIFLAVKLAPHLAAVVGVETGGRVRPPIAVGTLSGDSVTAAGLAGHVVLVNFWATWCLPCRVEMPALEAMYRRHRDEGFVVLGLSVDRGPSADVTAFLAARGIDYPVAIVGPSVERDFGGIAGYPTSVLLDRAGRIRQRAVGPLAMVSFEPAVRRLLAEGPPR